MNNMGMDKNKTKKVEYSMGKDKTNTKEVVA